MGADETLSRLWSGGKSGSRGPKAALSVDQIVDAAVGIADTEGIDAVSMSRVGEALGCSAMALYRHVSGKAQLLSLMVDAVAGLLPVPPRRGPWRDDLVAWTRAQIAGMVERPWILELPLTAGVPGPCRMRWMEAGFEILGDFDLPGDDKLEILGLLAQYVLSATRLEVETRRSEELRATGDEWSSDFEQILTDLADPAQFPHMFAAMGNRRGEKVDDDFGLQLILDGVAAHVARSA